jgi:glycosyltransferase involved in cell wall biosynthesis
MLWLARRLYGRAAGALAISHAVGVELASNFRVSVDRIFVVPNPVTRSTGRDDEPPQEVTRDSLHVAYVGRQAPEKRLSVFLAVLSDLARRGIDVRGTIIGDGPMRRTTEQECMCLGLDVSFEGWKEPWWDAAADIDCIVLTSRVEGFGNVLVEAAAAGIPCVASSRAFGVADAIVPGVTGELAMTDSPSDYAAAVLRATSRTPGSSHILRRWLDFFSVEHSTTCLVAALDVTIDQRSDAQEPSSSSSWRTSDGVDL